jgi:uncharacterized protein YndB with AHSA1/START domain
VGSGAKGRLSVAVLGDKIEHEVVIAAPPELVFEFFTVAARFPRWMGREATIDPRPGGLYRCVVHDNATVLGEYVIVEPPTRVVFTWGFEGNPDVPPGSSTVTVTLEPVETGTRLRLIHTGLPHPSLAAHDQGWQGHLAQLTDAAVR